MAKYVVIALQICVAKNWPTTYENVSTQSMYMNVHINTVYESRK